MTGKRWEMTKNPLRLLWGTVRYRTGLWVAHYCEKHGEWDDWTNKGHKIRRAIWEYGIDAEGDTNCIENPLLGKIIKWQQRHEKDLRVWAPLYSKGKNRTPAETRKMNRLKKRMEHADERYDHYCKIDDPRYITKAEEQVDFERRLAYYKEHGKFPEGFTLVRGGHHPSKEELWPPPYKADPDAFETTTESLKNG